MTIGDPAAQARDPAPSPEEDWGPVLLALRRMSEDAGAALVEVGTLSAAMGRPAPQLRGALRELERRQLVILVCGGTGVYVTGAGRRWGTPGEG